MKLLNPILILSLVLTLKTAYAEMSKVRTEELEIQPYSLSNDVLEAEYSDEDIQTCRKAQWTSLDYVKSYTTPTGNNYVSTMCEYKCNSRIDFSEPEGCSALGMKCSEPSNPHMDEKIITINRGANEVGIGSIVSSIVGGLYCDDEARNSAQALCDKQRDEFAGKVKDRKVSCR